MTAAHSWRCAGMLLHHLIVLFSFHQPSLALLMINTVHVWFVLWSPSLQQLKWPLCQIQKWPLLRFVNLCLSLLCTNTQCERPSIWQDLCLCVDCMRIIASAVRWDRYTAQWLISHRALGAKGLHCECGWAAKKEDLSLVMILHNLWPCWSSYIKRELSSSFIWFGGWLKQRNEIRHEQKLGYSNKQSKIHFL